MPCKSCGSLKQGNFTGEVAIHFPGLKNIDKPHRVGISRAYCVFGLWHHRINYCVLKQLNEIDRNTRTTFRCLVEEFQFDDRRRFDAGYKGKTGDSVVRSIAIGAGLLYQKISDLVNQRTSTEFIKRVMKSLGWLWTPTSRSARAARFISVMTSYRLGDWWSAYQSISPP